MSEEDISPKDGATDGGAEPEKATNRTWNQSEFDSAVAASGREIQSKYKDYEDVKSKLKGFEDAENTRKEAEMSEIEKRDTQITGLTEQVNKLTAQTVEDGKKAVKQGVLRKPEFSQLPDAYSHMIELSDNPDVVLESANKALLKFQEDFNVVGGPKPVIPKPKVNSKTPNGVTTDGQVSRFKQKLSLRRVNTFERP